MIPALANAVIVPPLLALLTSSAVVALVMRSRIGTLAVDHPNARSLHTTPTPRLGGIGIIAGVAAAGCYSATDIDASLLIALALLIGISLLDDLRSIAVKWRLCAHVASAALATSVLLQAYGWWSVLIATLATVWMINLYNFMDGSDGLAGGMTVIGFGSYGAAALAGGDISFAAINWSIAAAGAGFLCVNFPPARIFMGDVASIPLGWLAAVSGIAGYLRGDWPLWFGLVVFSPFIIDASYTLLRRLLRRARVWEAHREHLYQRLIQSGWGHRRTTLAEYALMLLCGGGAIFASRLDQAFQLTVLGVLALLYAALVAALERRLARDA